MAESHESLTSRNALKCWPQKGEGRREIAIVNTATGYRVHLDGYNQLDMLLGSADSKRKEVIYYEGPTLQAIRYGDWKAHFIVQNEGWFGAKEKLGAPLLFNLRRDP